MTQHNHWKLKQLQNTIIKFVTWGLGLLLLGLNLGFKKAIDFDLVSKTVGIISIIIGLVLSLLEKKLWKTGIMRLPFLEKYWTPVLEGRWEGILTRDGEPHNFVIEIIQSYTTISCITYSKHSSSSAYATEILYNDQLQKYQLIYYWHGGTTNVQGNTGDTNSFEGFTVLDIIIESGKATRLKGSYFTNRQPKQTKGTIDLNIHHETLKNSYD